MDCDEIVWHKKKRQLLQEAWCMAHCTETFSCHMNKWRKKNKKHTLVQYNICVWVYKYTGFTELLYWEGKH